MTSPGPIRTIVKALLSANFFAASAATAFSQSYSVVGQAGYLQEWEIKASLAKTEASNGADYYGAVTLRHVGLCSVNGVEEKTGIVQLKVFRKTLAIEGTLDMKDDRCRIVASSSKSYSGFLNCRDGQGVPISFSIQPTEPTEK
jgi:hypothetical protein